MTKLYCVTFSLLYSESEEGLLVNICFQGALRVALESYLAFSTKLKNSIVKGSMCIFKRCFANGLVLIQNLKPRLWPIQYNFSI